MIRDYDSRLMSKEEILKGVWHLAFHCPEIARAARPGNFVLIKTSRGTSPLLRRPFGILDADATSGTFEVLFHVVGQGTELLADAQEGEIFSVRGPAGGNFKEFKHDKVWAVAGGIGIVPLIFLRRTLRKFGELFFGVANSSWANFAEWVKERVPEMTLYSDDGSIGQKGFSISGLEGRDLSDVSLACCGPNPMMKALWRQYGSLCDDIQVSLEKRMACGMGGCFGCVVDTTTGRRRVCVDGPVFQASEVKWDELQL